MELVKTRRMYVGGSWLDLGNVENPNAQGFVNANEKDHYSWHEAQH